MLKPASFTPSSFSIVPLSRIEQEYCEHPDEYSQNSIEIWWIVQGTVTLITGKSRLRLTDNSLLCRMREKNDQLILADHTEGYVIRFSKSLLYCDEQDFDYKYQANFHQLLENVITVEPGRDFLWQLKTIFELLLQEQSHHLDLRMQMISQFLNILMLYLFRMCKMVAGEAFNPARHVILQKFEALVEQQYKMHKKVSDYAEQLFISPNYLNEIIKQTTGNSAGYFIRQRVVLEAIRQARYTGANMKQIAWKLGFTDIAHFSKFFKKQSGRTFSDFRKEEFSNAGLQVA